MSLGRWGEALAADYLLGRGYTLVQRNARTPYGEIDLVMRQAEVTVFVEVKTRTSDQFGFPEEAITARKREHLLAASLSFLQEHPEYEGDWRIDVIAIRRLDPGKPARIRHFENAIN
jgi:putative endonuclease